MDSRFRGNDKVGRARREYGDSRESGNPVLLSEPQKAVCACLVGEYERGREGFWVCRLGGKPYLKEGSFRPGQAVCAAA